jgi:type III restriction enzyme
VYAYAKNDHLDFVIPYQYEGISHDYRPDFLVRLKRVDGSELRLILEVKGFETEKDRAKEVAARRWVKAVNHDGQFGKWAYLICKEPASLKEELSNLLPG